MENEKVLKIKLGDNMSKAEEIEVLEKFLGALPEDSYLYLMFKGLAPWAVQQIEDDFGMNVIDTMDELRAMAAEYKKLNSKAEAALVEEMDKRQELAEKLQEEHRNKNEALAKSFGIQEEMTSLKREHGHEVAGLEMRIMELKVQVYDLEHPVG